MLLNPKRTASVLVSGALALTLVATAAEGATPAHGTASSALNAVTLTVTGVAGVPAVSLLDVGTLATTNPDAAGNLLGANFASALVTPATIGGAAQGEQGSRSDESSQATTQGVDLGGLGLPVGGVVAPINIVTEASEEGARAAIGAATAQLSVLTDLLGLEITSAGVDSIVNATSASQSQGITVGGLDVTLGDILPAELLAELPIDVLLDLLAQLPVGAPDVQAIVDAVTSLVTDVEQGVTGIVGAATGIDSGIAAITSAVQNMADQQAIVDGLNVDEAAAQLAVTNAATNVTAAVTAASNVAGSLAGLACVSDNLLNPAAATACIAALQSTANAAVTAAQAAAAAATATADQLATDLAAASSLLAPLASTVNVLTAYVNDLVAQLVTLVGNLVDTITDLLAALTNLSGSLGDVIEGLLNAPLLGLGNIDLSMAAVARDTVENSTASVTCALSGLVIAGVDLGGGDCTGSDLTGSLAGAVGSLQAALGALPVVGSVLPNVSVQLMQMSSSVTEADGMVTSTSSAVPMVINLPSIDIDPAGLLDGLLAQLSTDLLDDLLAQLPVPAELSGLGLNGAADQITAMLGGDMTELLNLEGLVANATALLPDGLGLTALTTPGFNLSIDPTSTATFTAGSAGPSAPAPGGTDPLPVTGGGAVVLAALGLTGAWSLRRRG